MWQVQKAHMVDFQMSLVSTPDCWSQMVFKASSPVSFMKHWLMKMLMEAAGTGQEMKVSVAGTAGSIPVFMGQCLMDEMGKELHKTTWLKWSHLDNRNPIMRGTSVFTRLVLWREGGIMEDFNTDENNWDADPLFYIKTGQCSQEKFGSAGDFETDGSA
ncbi:hypothetical protein AV530_019859 [Patagioenas fasciata monilis]|uniref:Uncharacterized protein n=1 Tax=Patagioenas fasciata monilis TaxID=372326 RepID=A0A1V4JTB4_PATFA|nr:hypothetical protein AV530_019859 [Patagioenas fasciata monilis]